MPIKESEAIVLRTFPLGEGDRLVSFLDRQSGRLRGVARGARMPKSRFGSTLELLSYIRIWYFERESRELVRINQCELIETFLDLQKDYQAGVYLALLSEITEAVLGEREVADPQFRLLLAGGKSDPEKRAEPGHPGLFQFVDGAARRLAWITPTVRPVRQGLRGGSCVRFARIRGGFLCRMPGSMGQTNISSSTFSWASSSFRNSSSDC